MKPCPSYQGYFADEQGNIFSTMRNGVPKKLKLCINDDGYFATCCKINGKWKNTKAHRLIADAWHGPQPSKNHQVCHIDGKRLNIRPSNLRWGTAKENALDRTNHGTCKVRKIGKEALPKRRRNALGVTKAPSGRWRAHIKINGKTKYLGTFDTFEEAKLVRNKAVEEVNSAMKADKGKAE